MKVTAKAFGKNELRWLAEGEGGHGSKPIPVHQVESSIRGKFRFVSASVDSAGLRAPQVGALHSILAFQSISPSEPATVVLPTGTGKTETMLATYCHQPKRTLVVVPSDSLRTQIGEKFVTLGILPKIEAISGNFYSPSVGLIKSSLKTPEEVREIVDHTCVLIATASVLSKFTAEALQAIHRIFYQVFIDEAHHVVAPTWSKISSIFSDRVVIQFTATPFREDGKIIPGRIIYAYPLKLAQENGWFARINYRSITSARDVDRELAIRAVDKLREDRSAGLDHMLMARVQSIPRANQLLAIYSELANDFQPIRIDSKLSLRRQQEAKSKLENRETRIVVCVDMLGEGFDLPALKIAAVHDPHKSLAVTLQFIGRFTRVGGDELGEASVFVPRISAVVDERLRRLYGEDADWNSVIRELTHAQIDYEQARSEFEAGFGELPAEVTIRNIQPKMSTVVYQSPSLSWNPNRIYELFAESDLLTKKIAVNEHKKVAWFVSAEAIPVRWSESSSFSGVEYNLYVLHADNDKGLLYINSSNTDSTFQELAYAVGGKRVALLKGDIVFRVLSHVKRRVPTNVGLLDAVNRNRRFSMHVGADVLEGFGPGAAQKSKTNIFAHGYANQSRVSVGASRKGRVWSHRVARTLLDWVNWATEVGSLITDQSIDLPSVMSGFIIPKAATSRPTLVPLGLEWPHDLGSSVSERRVISYLGSKIPLIDVELAITSFQRNGPIAFAAVSSDWSLSYEMSFGEDGPSVRSVGNDASISLPRGDEANLASFMTNVGLTIYFEKEALLSPDGYLLQPDRTRPQFPHNELQPIDWSGVDIKKESQGPNRDEDSVQHRVARNLMNEVTWDVVMDDDGPGEVADLVFIKKDDRSLHILLAHCKFSSSENTGARVKDLYEVCGQAAKCHKARSQIELTIRRLIRRERSRQRRDRSGFLVGDMRRLDEILDCAWNLDSKVTVLIAQPGLSKSQMSLAQSKLLGCLKLYLSETYSSDFRVLCGA